MGDMRHYQYKHEQELDAIKISKSKSKLLGAVERTVKITCRFCFGVSPSCYFTAWQTERLCVLLA